MEAREEGKGSMDKKEYILYKDKPLFRNKQTIYYGSPLEKYYIEIELDDVDASGKVKVAKKAVILLLENQNGMGRKNKIIKKAQRDGLYPALDVGVYWLADALTWK